MASRIQAGERAEGKKGFWGYVWQGIAAEGLTCNALGWQAPEGGGRIIEKNKTISLNNPAAIQSGQRATRWVGWCTTRRSSETGTETNYTACQNEKIGNLATHPSGRNQRSRSRAGRCPDLKVELAAAQGIKLEVSKRERLERQNRDGQVTSES
jgi:hypothetical protein